MQNINHDPNIRMKAAFLETDDFSIYPLEEILNKPWQGAIPFYTLIYFTGGKGNISIDFKAYPLTLGTMLFLSKGQIMEIVADRVQGWILLFKESYFEKQTIEKEKRLFDCLYHYPFEKPLIQIGHNLHNEISHVFPELHMEYQNPDNLVRDYSIRTLLHFLMLKLERTRQSAFSMECPNYQVFIQFQKKIEKHFNLTRKAQDYAEMLHITIKKLTEICKGFSSLTPKQIIDQFIIIKLKRYLKGTELSQNEITHHLGFDEPTNMIKFFKSHTNQTPTQFRSNK